MPETDKIGYILRRKLDSWRAGFEEKHFIKYNFVFFTF